MTGQSEQPERAVRTSIAITWPVRNRLADLTVAVQAKENRPQMTAGETVEWMLDVIDAADLP